MPIPIRADFDAQMVRFVGEAIERTGRRPAAFWLWRRFITKARTRTEAAKIGGAVTFRSSRRE